MAVLLAVTLVALFVCLDLLPVQRGYASSSRPLTSLPEAPAGPASTARVPCPGRLELCGVPCGCKGRNPSHYPPVPA